MLIAGINSILKYIQNKNKKGKNISQNTVFFIK